MSKLESQSDHLSHKASNFFWPSVEGVILYILFSMILLVVLNYGSLIHSLNNYIGQPQSVNASLSELSDNVSHTFSTALGGRLGQIILWSLIGAFSYIILWMVKNLFNSFENDIISDHYTHPTSYNRVGYWTSSLSVKVFLFATLVVALSYFYLCFKVFFPSIAALSGGAVYNFRLATSPFYLLLAIILGAFLLYALVLLLKLIVHLWRLL